MRRAPAANAPSAALEEAGLRVEAGKVMPLGPAMYATPGMCPELFHLVACEVTAAEAAAAEHPAGDGSPFEEGAAVRWVLLDDALAECARGEIRSANQGYAGRDPRLGSKPALCSDRSRA